MTSEVITINDNGQIEVNIEIAKTKPLLISLMQTIKEYNIDIDSLTNDETNDLLRCIIIVSQ